MRQSDKITLIKRSFFEDVNAIRVPVVESKEAFAYVDSVSATEFFEGSRTGMKPSYRFRMNRFDYDGQDIVEYCGARYKVYRTYIINGWIELYCERRKGTE